MSERDKLTREIASLLTGAEAIIALDFALEYGKQVRREIADKIHRAITATVIGPGYLEKFEILEDELREGE